jgi:hypothetical protein
MKPVTSQSMLFGEINAIINAEFVDFDKKHNYLNQRCNTANKIFPIFSKQM